MVCSGVWTRSATSSRPSTLCVAPARHLQQGAQGKGGDTRVGAHQRPARGALPALRGQGTGMPAVAAVLGALPPVVTVLPPRTVLGCYAVLAAGARGAVRGVRVQAPAGRRVLSRKRRRARRLTRRGPHRWGLRFSCHGVLQQMPSSVAVSVHVHLGPGHPPRRLRRLDLELAAFEVHGHGRQRLVVLDLGLQLRHQRVIHPHAVVRHSWRGHLHRLGAQATVARQRW